MLENVAPGTNRSIRVFLVEDQTIFREGVRVVLSRERDIEIVGEAFDDREALAKVIALRPDVVVMDISISGSDGITCIQGIRQQCHDVRVLILAAYADQKLFRKAAEAGASGYIVKDIAPESLAKAIRVVHQGGAMLSPAIAKYIMDYLFATRNDLHEATNGFMYGLTRRELDVLTKLVQGLSDKEIAAKLFLSESTVKTYLHSIYERLHVRNRVQAVAAAINGKLLENGPL